MTSAHGKARALDFKLISLLSPRPVVPGTGSGEHDGRPRTGEPEALIDGPRPSPGRDICAQHAAPTLGRAGNTGIGRNSLYFTGRLPNFACEAVPGAGRPPWRSNRPDAAESRHHPARYSNPRPSSAVVSRTDASAALSVTAPLSRCASVDVREGCDGVGRLVGGTDDSSVMGAECVSGRCVCPPAGPRLVAGWR